LVLALAAAPGRADIDQARHILNETGVKGGLIVHIGCGDGRLTSALRANDSYIVHGLDRDPENVVAARKHIQTLGQYGNIFVELWSGERLPYIDNSVNLVVSEDLGEVSDAEVMRVLCPKDSEILATGDRRMDALPARSK
jgi:ubiquinone/menaquinone biosynthesis C-methylase UbiE